MYRNRERLFPTPIDVLVTPSIAAAVESAHAANTHLLEVDPSIDFVHPYATHNWYWRMFFGFRRMVWLSSVFIPCFAVGAVAAMTESDSLRAYWLQMLTRAIGLAGCSFQKLAQWMSMRPDMFGPDVIEALSKLQQGSPQHAFQHTRAAIKDSFGKEIEEIFESFDENPIASGTVAQVYRGRLRRSHAVDAGFVDENGNVIQDVAVKIRHPAVLAETFLDLDLVFGLIKIGWLPGVFMPFNQKEVVINIQQQINLEFEAQNLIRFARNFRAECQAGTIQFPMVASNLLSDGVLIESWAPGQAVSHLFSIVGDNFKTLKNELEEELSGKVKATKKVLAKTILDFSCKMFLRDNLVHGDLHGGNVLVDSEGRCTILDVGLTTSLPSEIRGQFGDFLYAICVGDNDQFLNLISGMGSFSKEARPQPLPAFKKDVERTLARYVKRKEGFRLAGAPDGGPVELGDLFGDLFRCMYRHHWIMRGDIAQSIMTMSLAEGLIRSLDPEFDVVGATFPYFFRYNGWTNNPILQ